MSDHKLEIILAAKDATQAAFKSVTARITGISKQVFNMQNVMVSAAGAAGIGYFVKSQLEAADAIAKTADTIGISTKSLQEYQFMAERSGVATSQIESGLSAFVKRVGELKMGTGALNTILSKNNQELANQLIAAESTDAALVIYLDTLGGIDDQATKAALSAAAFSRTAGIKMTNMVKGGSAGLKEMRDDFERLGLGIDDKFLRQSEAAVDQFANLEYAIKARLMGAVVEAAPQITTLVGNMADWISENDTFLTQDVPRHVKDIADGIGDMAENVGAFIKSPEYKAMTEYWELMAGAAIGAKFGGVPGAVGGALMGAAYKGGKEYDSKTEDEQQLQVLELTLKTYEDIGLADTQRTNELRQQIVLLKEETNHAQELGDAYPDVYEPFDILGKMALATKKQTDQSLDFVKNSIVETAAAIEEVLTPSFGKVENLLEIFNQ